MIIKDLNGGTLSLTKTKLTELTGSSSEGYFYLNLKSLRDGRDVLVKQVPERHSFHIVDSLYVQTGIDAGNYITENPRIGCREFDQATYDKIIAAAEKARKTARAERKSGKSK